MSDPLGLFEADDADPLGLFGEAPKKKADWTTAGKQAIANAMNITDKAGALLGGGVLSAFGATDMADDMYSTMQRDVESRNKWANPDNQEIGFGGKLLNVVPGLLTSGLGPAETGMTLLDADESLATAGKGAAVDAAGNAVGMILPGFKQGTAAVRASTGFAANAAQDIATKKAIQALAETEKGKASFQWTAEDAAVAGVTGGVGAVWAGRNGKPPPASDKKLGDIRSAQAAKEIAKVVDTPTVDPLVDGKSSLQKSKEAYAAALREQELQRQSAFNRPEQLGNMEAESPMARMARDLGAEPGTIEQPMSRTAQDLTNRPMSAEQMDEMNAADARDKFLTAKQMEIDDTPHVLLDTDQVIAPQYGTDRGIGRVDENGMPIRADRSMEAQNLENPLQRNLWGDELPRESGQEAPRGITTAIDMMDNTTQSREGGKFVKGTPQSNAVSLLSGNPPLGTKKAGFDFRKKRGQGGKIDENLLTYGVAGLINRLRSNPNTQQPMRKLMGLFRGTFNENAIKEAYNQSLDPNSRMQLYMMSPDQFLTLAKRREPWEVAGQDSTNRREAIKKGLETEAGLDDIPYLRVNEKGEITGHEGRHRAEVLASKLDLIPVRMETPYHKNEAGALPFERLQPQDPWGSPSRYGEPLLTTESRGNHGYTETANTKGTLPFNFKKQGGGLLIGEANKIDNSLAKSDDGTFIPENPKIADVLEKARTEKDGRMFTYLQSGATSTAMKTGSTAIKAASEIVQNAIKRADLAIRNNVFPAETSLRKLKNVEIDELATLFKDEMFKGERYDGDILAQHLTVKQLEAYRNMRDLFDRTLDAQNEARLAKGQDPISPKEAYLSSRWQGDFRRPVYDKDGKLVWYLASNTKMGLESQSKALLKDMPDLVIDKAKDHTVSSTKSGNDLQSIYTTMLDLLGRDDPAIQQIAKLVEDRAVIEGDKALGQTKHFENKGNIRGFVGDRPGHTGPKESTAMFQQQIQYAKNAFQWAEMQKAAGDIKGIIADPDLQSTQPNNVKYIREYFKNAVGMGESKVARALDDAIRKGGISPNTISHGVGVTKSLFIMQKLAVSAGYSMANFIQAANVLPYLVNLQGQGYKGNPAVAMVVGVPAGLAMGVSHYLKAVGGEYINKLPNQFFKDAFQYAEDNGVTSRSIYDESPLNTNNTTVNTTARVGSVSMSAVETLVRSVAFMTYSQMLKDSGRFTDQSKLFQKAEELTNKSMVDYRESERPMMFAKAGTAGNFLNTLQTYPMSFYNQYSYMIREAVKGRPGGLVTMLALQYAVAGAMGLPGFDDMDKLYKYIRDELVKTSTWNEMAKSPFMSDPKLWMLENFGDASVYGALSDKSGLGMTSRVAAPGAGAMLQSPAGPVMDIYKQATHLGAAVLDPTNSTKWAQFGMSFAPVGLQGLLETSDMMKDYTYIVREDGTKVMQKTSDLAARKGGYIRTPEEEAIRKWGIRSQQEVKSRDVAYATSSANQALTKRSGELIDQYYSAARRGDKARAKELATLYVDITGNELQDSAFEKQVNDEFLGEVEKIAIGSKSPRQLLNAARMKKILEETK